MTFLSPDGPVALRFLRPVALFRPGEATPTDVPADYLAYLLAQAGHGAVFDDQAVATIDGRAATVVTATTTQSLDGSLGCPDVGIAAEDCFGLQDDLSLRMAIVPTDDGPLLIWLRSSVGSAADVAAQVGRFDAVLAGIRFRS